MASKGASRTCIWCSEPTRGDEPEEHIIPESLGCPPGLVFRSGEVCQGCNNNELSRVDAGLLKVFDPMRALQGPTTKRGRWPNKHFKNGSIERNAAGQLIRFQRGKQGPLECYWSPLQIDPTRVKLSMKVRFGRPLSRGLHKVVFGAFIHQVGVEAAGERRFGSVRRYVLADEGPFRRVLIARRYAWTRGQPWNAVHPAWYSREGHGPFMEVRLCGVDFHVSLDETDESLIAGGRELNELLGGHHLVTSDRNGYIRALT